MGSRSIQSASPEAAHHGDASGEQSAGIVCLPAEDELINLDIATVIRASGSGVREA
jgi:hypothetical protein